MKKEGIENIAFKISLIMISVIPILYFNQIENVPIKAFILGGGSWGIGLILKMIAHQLIVVRLHQRKVQLIYESIVNGFLSGIFELLGAFVIIIFMLPKFVFDFNAIICFGLAIGSLESAMVAWNGDNLLKGTTLESSASRLISHMKNLEGFQYYFDNYMLLIFERILATFLHISTRGMIFLTIITNNIFPTVLALIVFIIADGLLGYNYIISGKLINSKNLYRFYAYLFLLTVISSIYFFTQISSFQDITL